MEGFGLGERFVAELGQGHAAARLLDARPRERRVEVVASIHEKRARAHLPADTQCGRFVLREDGSRQSVRTVVHQRDGLFVTVDRHDAADRTETLLAHDAHAVVDLR